MAAAPLRRELAPPLPGLWCPLGSGPRESHEWAPRATDGFYCTACLARLRSSDLDDWKLLLKIETQRGETTLSGGAYQVLVAIIADAVALSPAERRLMLRLAAEPAYVVPHDDLGEALWCGEALDADARTALRQQVTALRRKLARLRPGVTAVPSVGYRLMIGREDRES